VTSDGFRASYAKGYWITLLGTRAEFRADDDKVRELIRRGSEISVSMLTKHGPAYSIQSNTPADLVRMSVNHLAQRTITVMLASTPDLLLRVVDDIKHQSVADLKDAADAARVLTDVTAGMSEHQAKALDGLSAWIVSKISSMSQPLEQALALDQTQADP